MLGLATAPAQTNSWTYPSDGKWEDSYWSLGHVPTARETAAVTNPGSKTVVIGPATAVDNPDSTHPSALIISGADQDTNTVLIESLGSIASYGPAYLWLGTNGVLHARDSSLGIFDGNLEGTVVQEGGSFWLGSPFSQPHINGGHVLLTNVQCVLYWFSLESPGTLEQMGGNVETGPEGLLMLSNRNAGTYILRDGQLQAQTVTPGHFVQFGGTASVSNLMVNFGDYIMYGGTLLTSNLWVRAAWDTFSYTGSGRFEQHGGNTTAADIFGPPAAQIYLSGGSLLVGGENFGGDFSQSGGLHVVTNELELSGQLEGVHWPTTYCSYSLGGGVLACSELTMHILSGLSQTGGSNLISGTLNVGWATWYWPAIYGLSGGTLATSNSLSYEGAIWQSGGMHVVSNLLSLVPPGSGYNLEVQSAYLLSGGTLIASNIDMEELFAISSGTNGPPQIFNSGFFKLNSVMRISGPGLRANLGRFILAGWSQIDFGSNDCILRFADSSDQSWVDTLTLIGWNGSTNGGGSTQVFFGSNSSGLTSSQLTQLRFVNPTGFPAGVYPAAILDSGEVVPQSPARLEFTPVANGILLTWPAGYSLQTATSVTGPYYDIYIDTGPYLVQPGNEPERFFRLRR